MKSPVSTIPPALAAIMLVGIPAAARSENVQVYREGVFSAPLYRIKGDEVVRIGCATIVYESDSLDQVAPDLSGRRRCPTGQKEVRPDLAASLPPRDPKATAYLIFEDAPNQYFWIVGADGRFTYVAFNRNNGETSVIHEGELGED